MKPASLVAWLLAFAPLAAGAEALRAGFAEVDITPPAGYRKAGGYGEVISAGVDDPLMAKAMVLESGAVRFALVVSDLTGIPEALSTRAREAITQRTGIPVSHLVIAATHNHGAPEYWGPLRDVWHAAAMARDGRDAAESVDYPALLVERWAESVVKAAERVREASLELLVAEQDGLAFNRRFHLRDGSVRFNPGKGNPHIVRAAGPVDTELPFLLARGGDGAALGALTIFAMHTATGGDRKFGADFPGHLASHLRQRFGGGFVSIFGEGTAGDVNHIDVRSTRKQPGETEPARIGAVLAGTLLERMEQARPLKKPSLAVRMETVRWPLRPAIQEARYHAAKALLAGQGSNGAEFLQLVAAWRDCHHWELQQRFGGAKPLEVQVVRCDEDTALVALPHEVFVEIGMHIKAASPFRHTLVLSLANDVDFYIPTRRAFEEGSYEVTTCPLQPGCGEALATTALKLLNELKPR